MDITPPKATKPQGPATGTTNVTAPVSLESNQEPRTKTAAPLPERGITRRRFAAAAIAGLLVIGGGAYIATHMTETPHIGITTTTGEGEAFGSAAFYASDDQVTEKQWQQRADAFAAFKAKGPVVLERADPDQATVYADQTLSDPQQKQTLQAQLRAKSVDLVAVGFFDDCAVDGDVVAVHAGAVNVIVPLTHKVQYVLIPVPKGGTTEVDISGIKDGTGGITLGMVTPNGVLHMPRLEPGQQTSFTAK